MILTVPAELAPHRQFVTWRWEERNGRPTKPPYNARTGDYADSTDPTTWSTLPEALAAVAYYDGVGFVLTERDPFVGIDLDHCREAETGLLEPWAREIIDALASYTEITPSRTGVRVFVRGTLPAGGRKRGPVDMYDRSRYLTVTGDHLAGTPTTIEERTEAIHCLHARVFAPVPAPTNGHVTATPIGLDDAALIERASRAKNGPQFTDLWQANITAWPSHSEADLAFCNLLAFWTARDASRMDHLFRQSGLMRPKWDERHGARTYGAITIDKAIEGCRETYTPREPAGILPAVSIPEPAPLAVPDAALVGIARDFALLYAEHLESPAAFFYFDFLTYVGNLIADKVTLGSELRPEPRLYVVKLGESADSRKSTSQAKVDQFFQTFEPPFQPRVLKGIGSAEGLAAELAECPRVILFFDELKAFVDKAKNEGSVALPMVNTLFESGDYDNRTKAGRLTIRGARLSLVAACTTDTYATMFDQKFIAIGFPNRLWLVYDRPTRRIPLPLTIPDAKLAPIRHALTERLKAVDAAWVAKGLRPVAYDLTSGARSLWNDWYMARGSSIFERRLDTYGHRLMLLLAVVSGRDIIDQDIASAVIDLLRYQLDVRRECDPVDADNAVAEMEEKIRRVLARGRLGKRDLMRRVHYNRSGIWVFSQAATNLGDVGELAYDPKTSMYWLTESVTSSVTTISNRENG